MKTLQTIGLLLMFATATAAQAPAPPPAQAAQAPPSGGPQPTIPEALRLERENLLLQARVNELETQLAAMKSQIINERIGKAAPALIERLQAAAPGFDVDPQTLEFRPQAPRPALPPATPPPATQPQPRPQ